MSFDELHAARDAAERNAALRKWARNDRHCTAAVELLIAHGCWLNRLEEVGLVEWFPQPEDDRARLNLHRALEKLDDPKDHDLYTSSSEYRVLSIASSLVHGTPISLTATLQGLDRSNQRLVLDALALALGMVEPLR